MFYSNNTVYRSTDENQYRIQSATLAMITAAYIVTSYLPLLVLLCYDFAVRALISQKLSPLYHLSRYIVNVANIPECNVSTAPKLIATKVWLVLSLVILYFALSGNDIVSLLLATLLLLCVSADAFMHLCVGCHIDALLKRYNITITSLKEY